MILSWLTLLKKSMQCNKYEICNAINKCNKCEILADHISHHIVPTQVQHKH